MRKYVIIVVLFFSSFAGVFAQNNIEYNLCDQDFRPINMRANIPANAIYRDTKASAEARAKDVVIRLTFGEKLMLTGGWKIMHFPALERLGLPPVYFSDASQGIHVKNHCVKVERSTSFPAAIALAATWNTDLAYNYAKSIGEECRAWGISVLLGPGMNMYRNAEGGRNFEYFGEDPMLTTALSVNYVKGLQQTGTIATIKHFIGNEQEFARHVINIKIGERALREIYLPPFKASIEEAGALAVMAGNNEVNGYPGAANKPLSQGVLRDEYGFKGVVMSDWANSTFWPEKHEMELNSGHSLLMANNETFSAYINQQVKDQPQRKKVIESHLDTMVYHNLYTFFKAGIYNRPYRDPALLSTFDAHKKIALQTAEEGITLLKNENNILPIKPGAVKKIAVVGTEEALKAYTGTGSGMVEGYDQVDYLSGLKKIYGDKIISGNNLTDKEISSADVVLYFTTRPSGEGFDFDFNLPDLSDSVNHYASLNKNLVIIHSGGNGFKMPWLLQVKGFVFAYLLGQEAGDALAEIISGKVNPSGKLPFTIEKDFSDSPAKDYNKMSDGKYYWRGGKPNSKEMQDRFGDIASSYDEGIYIGYRWYQKKNIQPQFSFGYGLSYASFAISNIAASSKKITKEKPATITCTVTNTGTVAGAEVVQLYINKVKRTVDRPLKELKGFKKVFLQPGETKKVSFEVNVKDLSFWSETEKAWKAEPGDFIIEVGNSSVDIQQRFLLFTERLF